MRASARSVPALALENVPPGRRFDLLEGPDETYVGTVRSRELREGIEVELRAEDTAKVLLINPVGAA
jgi:hypothetical protein